uniref:Mei2-like C-terminal RNA recognition motif domain-containing protein n=1 Tax=Alexandrium monilatum TaxID=311494 RepID=A0A7S4QFQ2_9DINO
MDAVLRGFAASQNNSAKRNNLQVLEGSLTAGLSNTVCISDPSGEWLSVQSKAVKEFSEFGDVARLDLSLVVVLKCVILTYFDVRSTQQVLLNLAGRAEPFPAAAHDCRIVRVKTGAFFEKAPMLAANGGFAQFGEVAHMAMCGNDALVEFFDMRAAQMLLAAAGDTASPWMLASRSQQPAAALSVTGASGGAGLEGLGAFFSSSLAGHPPGGVDATTPASAGTTPAAPPGLADATPATSAPPGLFHNQQGMSPLAKTALAAEEGSYGCDSSPTTTAGTANSTAALGNSDSSDPIKADRGGNRPVRTKVTTKEFSKYDIDPDKIQRSQDSRTTVMVRNLSGHNARKDFLHFLERCGLQDRYSFFYMPCKEHRNVPAGFAFVNFAAPTDVHKLYVMVKSGFWREFMTDPMAKAPAMSYARFQGHEELAKHFNSSAVLHEQDPDKRPIFRLEVLKAIKEESAKAGTVGATKPSPQPKVTAAPPTVQAPAPVFAKDEHMYTAVAGAGSGNAAVGEDLHAVLSKGAKEIAAILMRQAGQAPLRTAVPAGGQALSGMALEPKKIPAKDDGSPVQIAAAGMGA